jgi:hypothetical protein
MDMDKVTTEFVDIDKLHSLIGEAKNIWSSAKKNIWELGRLFSEMRRATAHYKKNDKSGMSYSQATNNVGISHATAEFYRNMYDTCENAGIGQDVFLALFDSGVNLASERFAAACGMDEVKSVDFTNSESVKVLSKRLKKDFPAPKQPNPKLAELINEHKKFQERANVETDLDYKSFLTGKANDLAEQIEKERDRLKESLLAVVSTLNAITDWWDDPQFMDCRSAFESFVGITFSITREAAPTYDLPSGDGPVVKKPASSSGPKQGTKKQA